MTSFHTGADACPRQARDRGSLAGADAGNDGGTPEKGALWDSADPDLAPEADLDFYLRRLFLPLRRDERGLVVALADSDAENIAWLAAALGSARFVAVSKTRLIAEVAKRFAGRLTDDAIFLLARQKPALSAQRVVTRAQAFVFVLLIVAVAVATWFWPLAVLAIVVAAMSLISVASIVFRAALAWLGALPTARKSPPAAAADDASLPPYSVLVPLYREARVLPGLARALLAIDYPANRLQIVLIVEDDDCDTASAAEALAARGRFEVVRVPPSLPRTKPKAANFALRFARGDFVVIYDAEDRPEPDQLRKAVAEFRRRARGTACLQARLVPNNVGDGWLPGVYAADFDLWFDVFLPGLERLGLPIPLGGTSNHFRARVLRATHAWDPFNVTEDADLGIRLAMLGYGVAMLDSTTFEEAPARIGVWIRQRSRWLKGYMQTLLVHCRNPRQSIARVGVGGYLAFQLFIGGAVLSALVNPLLWAIFIASYFVTLPLFGDHSGRMLFDVSAAGALGTNGLLTYLAVIGSRRRDRDRLALYGLTVTLYWILISVAGYRALWHLATKPFHWEKTVHGLSNPSLEDSHG